MDFRVVFTWSMWAITKQIVAMKVPASLGKSCPWGRKTEGTKKENAGFSSAQNTCKIYGVCSRVAVAQLSCFNCQHSHWLLLMWALVG